MNQKPSKVFVVLGMHRGGTSALMGALRLLGVFVGENLLPIKEDNTAGFWEHAEIIDLHERLLERLGSYWHDVLPLPNSWWTQASVRPIRNKLVNLLRRDFGAAPVWGIKDPRFCRLLPLWLEIFDELGCRPHFIHVLRHPLEIAASLQKRDAFSKEKSLFLWLDHTLQGEHFTRGLPRAWTYFPDLLKNHRRELGRLGDELGTCWPRSPQEADTDLTAFLKGDLRHHRVQSFRKGSNPTAKRAREIYQLLRNGEPSAEHRTVLDRNRQDLLQATQLLGSIFRQQKTVLDQWIEEVLAARKAHETRDAREAALEQTIRAQSEEIEAIRKDRAQEHTGRSPRVGILETPERATNETNGDHSRYEERIQDLRGQVEKARITVGERDMEIDDARKNIDGLTAEIARARLSHQARDAIEASLRASLESHQDQLANARTSIRQMTEEIEQARRSHEARDLIEDSLRGSLSLHLEQLSEARASLALLTEEVAQARRSHKARDAIEASLRESLANHQEQLSAAMASIQQLSEEIERARRSHEARNAIEASLREEIQTWRDQLRALATQKERLDQALVERLEEIDRARENIDSLVMEVDQARNTIGGLVAQVDASRELNEKLKVQNEIARKVHEEKDDEIGQARKNIHQLVDEVATARRTINGLAEQIESARQAHRTRDLREQRLREALESIFLPDRQPNLRGTESMEEGSSLELLVETAKATTRKQKETIGELQATLRQMRIHLEEKQEQTDLLQKKISELETSLEALKSRWRYKITHPVEWWKISRLRDKQ